MFVHDHFFVHVTNSRYHLPVLSWHMQNFALTISVQLYSGNTDGSKLHRPPVVPALVITAPLPSHTGLTGQVTPAPRPTPAPSSPNDQEYPC